MLELTISFESSAEVESWRRKEAKYEELVEAEWVAGYRVKLITLEVGLRGMATDDDITTIKDTVHASPKAVGSTISSIVRIVILESFKIWCSWNVATELS